MIYALRNKVTGKLMAGKYLQETDNPTQACLYVAEKNAKLSINRRLRTAEYFNGRVPPAVPPFPTEYEIVAFEMTEVK